MAVAMIRPKEKGGRGKLSSNAGEFSKHMLNKISEARTTLEASKDLAERVLNGTKLLAEALRPAPTPPPPPGPAPA